MRGWEVAGIGGDAAEVVSAVVMGAPYHGAGRNGKGSEPH
jgi:hypothetical protein